MFEIVRWVSLIALWVALAINLWAFLRSQMAYKRFNASAAEFRKLVSLHKGRPPVIYCYECEYFDKAKTNDKGFLICPASGMDITGHDYCSYAERKQEDLTSEEK